MPCACDRLPPDSRPCYWCQNPRTEEERAVLVQEGIERAVEHGKAAMKRIIMEKEQKKLRKRKSPTVKPPKQTRRKK